MLTEFYNLADNLFHSIGVNALCQQFVLPDYNFDKNIRFSSKWWSNLFKYIVTVFKIQSGQTTDVKINFRAPQKYLSKAKSEY